MVPFRLRPLSTFPFRPQKNVSILNPFLTPIFSRNASHASEGRANKPAQGPGKRLGAKKGATELVVPGNIIFRQRGTKWFPGENCDMGRDHTIFATAKGYVTFYSDPERHPRRKYIGVVFERGMKLPTPRNAARRRRLGMVAREMSTDTLPPKASAGKVESGDLFMSDGKMPQIMDQSKQTRAKVPALKNGYMFRESNSYIGRAAERAGVEVEIYNKKDRFAAWRRRTAQIEEAREKKATEHSGSASGSKKRKARDK